MNGASLKSFLFCVGGRGWGNHTQLEWDEMGWAGIFHACDKNGATENHTPNLCTTLLCFLLPAF
jgi:hypothetical protein